MPVSESTEPLWLLAARKDLAAGVKEVPGKKAHPRIIEMYETVGLAHSGDDTDAWCGCAMGTWLHESGYPMPINAYGAKQFEMYGKKIDEFRPGAIGVFYRTKLREKDWRRHVAIIVGETKTHYECLGGNQGDGVSIAKFPKKDLSSMRWPVEATVADLRKSGSTEIKQADRVQNGGWLVTFIPSVIAAVKSLFGPVEVPEFASITESLSWWQTLLGGINAVGKLVGAHPWLAGTTAVGLVCILVGRQIKARRVAKHISGVPLSVEVAKMEAA